jgi:hypothetical protein
MFAQSSVFDLAHQTPSRCGYHTDENKNGTLDKK